jgi:hypothetical protein
MRSYEWNTILENLHVVRRLASQSIAATMPITTENWTDFWPFSIPQLFLGNERMV